jgi:hypothetical protein
MGLTISNYTTLRLAQWVTRQNQPSATHSHWFASTVNTALFDMGHMHLLEPSFQRVALGCSYCLRSRWAFSTFVSGTTQKSSGFENCPLWLQKTWKGRNSQGESTEQVDRNCDFEAKTELYCVKQQVLCNAQNKSNWQFKKKSTNLWCHMTWRGSTSSASSCHNKNLPAQCILMCFHCRIICKEPHQVQQNQILEAPARSVPLHIF